MHKRRIQNTDLLVSPICLGTMTFGSGLLTGKYHRGEPAPADSRKAEAANWVPDMTDDLFDRIEQLEIEARCKGRKLFEHAILAVLKTSAVVSAVLGVKRIDQLETMIRIAEKLEY